MCFSKTKARLNPKPKYYYYSRNMNWECSKFPTQVCWPSTSPLPQRLRHPGARGRDGPGLRQGAGGQDREELPGTGQDMQEKRYPTKLKRLWLKNISSLQTGEKAITELTHLLLTFPLEKLQRTKLSYKIASLKRGFENEIRGKFQILFVQSRECAKRSITIRIWPQILLDLEANSSTLVCRCRPE